MDTSKDKVIEIIREEEEKEKIDNKIAVPRSKTSSESLFMNKLYLDAVIDIESVIKESQIRMWKALKVKPEFKISLSETQRVLERFVESKPNLVILHIDLVGSTKMSMSLSIDRLSAIIRAFAQETSLVISMYGGYVLKYIGDAVLAFFVIDTDRDSNDKENSTMSSYFLQGRNAVSCARTIVKVITQGLNPILNQYDYPELKIRIGIDFGEIGVVQYGIDIDEFNGKAVFTRPHIDLIGSTISIAVKMTSIAGADQIVIGERLYNMLDDRQKSTFKKISGDSNVWNYIHEISEGTYWVYASI